MLLPLSSSSGPPKWIYARARHRRDAGAGRRNRLHGRQGPRPPSRRCWSSRCSRSPRAAEPAQAGRRRRRRAPARQADDDRRRESAAARGERRGQGREGEKAEKGEHEHRHGKGTRTPRRGAEASRREEGCRRGGRCVRARREEARQGLARRSARRRVSRRQAAAAPGTRRCRTTTASRPPSAGPLAKSAVVAGMNSVKPKVAACYNEFKVQGMAMVNVVIGKSGKVTSATVTGKFAGTPTGRLRREGGQVGQLPAVGRPARRRTRSSSSRRRATASRRRRQRGIRRIARRRWRGRWARSA